MSTFAATLNPTPFGVFDSEVDFQNEADNMVTFVKRAMGDDVLSVELAKKQIWMCFEEASLTYSSMINTHQAKNQLMTLLGQATGSLSGSEQMYLRGTLAFLERQAEPYAFQAGVGGAYNHVMGHVKLVQGQQDYDLTTDLLDVDGNVIYDMQPTGSKTRLRVLEVLHFSPSAAYRFFDSTSAINYLNNEFSFESFTPETIFYVLPVFEDILRASQMDVSQRVRRSNYSYDLIGTKLRIYPAPWPTNPRNLYLKVMAQPDPTGRNNLLSGSSGLTYQDDTIYGVSNVSNVPYGNIPYSKINSVGRQWIRQYTLALSRELLGLVRSKFQTVPIPGADLQMNGEALISQGREDKEKLVTSLQELLDSMTYDQMIQREADKSDNLIRQLKGIPIQTPIFMA